MTYSSQTSPVDLLMGGCLHGTGIQRRFLIKGSNMSKHSHLLGLCLVFLLAGQSRAQNTETRDLPEFLRPQPVTIPLDENAPDVKALRKKTGITHPYAEYSKRSFSPKASAKDKFFLAAIDLSKVDFTGLRRSLDLPDNPARAFAPNLLARTVYGDSDTQPTWFQTTYQFLNATLHCHWVYDARASALLAAQQAKIDEAKLERARRRQELGLPPEPEARTEKGPSIDSETRLIEKERQFKIAGRPCQLIVVCRQEDDPRCSDTFVDQLARHVITVRTGD